MNNIKCKNNTLPDTRRCTGMNHYVRSVTTSSTASIDGHRMLRTARCDLGLADGVFTVTALGTTAF